MEWQLQAGFIKKSVTDNKNGLESDAALTKIVNTPICMEKETKTKMQTPIDERHDGQDTNTPINAPETQMEANAPMENTIPTNKQAPADTGHRMSQRVTKLEDHMIQAMASKLFIKDRIGEVFSFRALTLDLDSQSTRIDIIASKAEADPDTLYVHIAGADQQNVLVHKWM